MECRYLGEDPLGSDIKEIEGGPNWSPSGRQTWQMLSALVSKMPDDALAQNAHAATDWLRGTSIELGPSLNRRYWKLWDRMWSLSENQGDAGGGDFEDRAVTAAINHPAGYLTEALFKRLWERDPQAGDLIPNDLQPRFDRIVVGHGYGAYLGRVILTSRLSNLFALDPNWTEESLIPLLEWDSSDEVPGLWQGFMWAPRFSPSFLKSMKPHFLKAVQNSNDIGGRSGSNLRRIFTFLSLETETEFSKKEITSALASMSANDLTAVVRALEDTIGDAGAKSQDVWRNTVSKFIRNYWPRTTASRNDKSTEALSSLAIATNEAFSDAVRLLTPLMVPKVRYGRTQRDLQHDQNHLVNEYPEDVLDLLHASLLRQQGFRHYGLRDILNSIAEAQPKLSTSNKFKLLHRYS